MKCKCGKDMLFRTGRDSGYVCQECGHTEPSRANMIPMTEQDEKIFYLDFYEEEEEEEKEKELCPCGSGDEYEDCCGGSQFLSMTLWEDEE
jgi:hypothetical protein